MGKYKTIQLSAFKPFTLLPYLHTTLTGYLQACRLFNLGIFLNKAILTISAIPVIIGIFFIFVFVEIVSGKYQVSD